MNQPHYLDYSKGKNLSTIEHEILAFLIQDSQQETTSSIRSTAKKLTTSTATIIRLCKKLGFSGYTDFVQHLQLEHIKQHPTADMQQLHAQFATHTQANVAHFTETAYSITPLELLELKKLLTTSTGIVITTNQDSELIAAEYLQQKLQQLGLYATVLSPKETLLHFTNKTTEMGLLLLLAEHQLTSSLNEKLTTIQDSNTPLIGFLGINASKQPTKKNYSLTFHVASQLSQNKTSSFNANIIFLLDSLLALF